MTSQDAPAESQDIIEAANRFAASQVNLNQMVEAAKAQPKIAERLLGAGRMVYQSCFEAFVAGAKWAIENKSDSS